MQDLYVHKTTSLLFLNSVAKTKRINSLNTKKYAIVLKRYYPHAIISEATYNGSLTVFIFAIYLFT
jgi:hypothetical protein